MTRGNQREVDRVRAQRRAERKGKSNSDRKKEGDGRNNGQTLSNKMERDAEIMRQKQQAALAKKASQN